MLSYADVSRAIPRIFLAQTFKSRGQKGVSPLQRECRANLQERVWRPRPMKYHMQVLVLLTNSFVRIFFILFHLKLEKDFHKLWSVFVNKLLNGGFTWDCVIYKAKIKKYRSSHPEMFCKNGVLRNFERDSGRGFFLWILQNFKVQLFLQNTSGGSF